MKYQVGHIVSTESNEKIAIGQRWISENNSIIEIDDIENGISFHYLYMYNQKKWYRTEKEFREQFLKIILEDIHECLKAEDISDIIERGPEKTEFINNHIPGMIDKYSLKNCIKEYYSGNGWDGLIEDWKEEIEKDIDNRIVQIDTLEKEYLFEEFQEKIKKI